jgi:hypothetical protein
VPNSPTDFWISFWYWFSFYVWIWLGFAVSMILYIVIICKRDLLFAQRNHVHNKILWNLIGYPFILVLSWLIVCVKDTTAAVGNKIYYSKAILMLGISMACSQGLFTSIYFFYVNMETLQKNFNEKIPVVSECILSCVFWFCGEDNIDTVVPFPIANQADIVAEKGKFPTRILVPVSESVDQLDSMNIIRPW